MWGALALGCLLAPILMPIAPVNSFLWNNVTSKSYDFREEVGWPDLVDTIALYGFAACRYSDSCR